MVTIANSSFLSSGGLISGSLPSAAGTDKLSLRNAMDLGNWLVLWQSPYGGPDPLKCPYRSPHPFTASSLHGVAPSCRALYRLYGATGVTDYKVAADRYATFFLTAIHDPLPPEALPLQIGGATRVPLSSAWMLGKALSPCYEWFVRHNPHEDAYELKAHAIYRWLQRHRHPESYFGVGYPCGEFADAQFSCDLGEVGSGLVGFYNVSGYRPALDDAFGLAEYFLNDYREGSGRGIWSPQRGTWLVGPWPGGGAEHFTHQAYNQTGWGWSCLVVGEFLLALRQHTRDAARRAAMAEKCLQAWQWCHDACQFEDGAHGMFGRDDKWVGMTAVPVLLYAALRAENLVPEEVERTYRPRVERSWRWLLEHTRREGFPPDGYLRGDGSTSKKPLENLVWMMAWALEALIEGGKIFEE